MAGTAVPAPRCNIEKNRDKHCSSVIRKNNKFYIQNFKIALHCNATTNSAFRIPNSELFFQSHALKKIVRGRRLAIIKDNKSHFCLFVQLLR